LREFFGQLSLLHGWLPPALQVLALLVVVTAVDWRRRSWFKRVLPAALIAAAAVTGLSYWYIGSIGLAGDPAPASLWLWIAMSGLAAAVVLLGGWAVAGGVADWPCFRCPSACCAPPWP